MATRTSEPATQKGLVTRSDREGGDDRVARDRVQARIVWKGGDTTTLSIPVPVGALKDLTGAEEMERIILERSAAGVLDETIAQELTKLGHRSPMSQIVLPSTVKSIRLRHKRSQSHPRRIEGALTIRSLLLLLTWTHIGFMIVSITDHLGGQRSKTRLFLFPDEPETIEHFKLLRLAGSSTCVFQGGIKMHDRSSQKCRPRETTLVHSIRSKSPSVPYGIMPFPEAV